jgi:hypothetical protein
MSKMKVLGSDLRPIQGSGVPVFQGRIDGRDERVRPH